MRRHRAARRLTFLVGACASAVLAAAALVACGNGSGESADPADVLACMKDAGIDAELKTTPDPGPDQPRALVRASFDSGAIAAAFFESPSAMAAYIDSDAQAAINGARSEVQETGRTTALIVEGIGVTDEERDAVLGCLG